MRRKMSSWSTRSDVQPRTRIPVLQSGVAFSRSWPCPVPLHTGHAVLPFPSHVGHGWSSASIPSGTPAYEPIPPQVLQVTRPEPLHVAQVAIHGFQPRWFARVERVFDEGVGRYRGRDRSGRSVSFESVVLPSSSMFHE